MQKLITNAEHTSSTTQKLEKTTKTSFPEADLVGKQTFYPEICMDFYQSVILEKRIINTAFGTTPAQNHPEDITRGQELKSCSLCFDI